MYTNTFVLLAFNQVCTKVALIQLNQLLLVLGSRHKYRSYSAPAQWGSSSFPQLYLYKQYCIPWMTNSVTFISSKYHFQTRDYLCFGLTGLFSFGIKIETDSSLQRRLYLCFQRVTLVHAHECHPATKHVNQNTRVLINFSRIVLNVSMVKRRILQCRN